MFKKVRTNHDAEQAFTTRTASMTYLFPAVVASNLIVNGPMCIATQDGKRWTGLHFNNFAEGHPFPWLRCRQRATLYMNQIWNGEMAKFLQFRGCDVVQMRKKLNDDGRIHVVKVGHDLQEVNARQPLLLFECAYPRFRGRARQTTQKTRSSHGNPNDKRVQFCKHYQRDKTCCQT